MSIYLAHFAMSWTSYIITVWLPYYLSKHLKVNATALSFTAVPYVVNSFASICMFANNSLNLIFVSIFLLFFFYLVAGHLADSMIMGNWTILSVRRTMTMIGLIGPAIFMLLFMSVETFGLAIL